MDPLNIHGTALDLHGTGLLIRGPSGAGKSLLALDLIDNHGAMLIADDRVDLTVAAELVWMACPPPLLGRIELRGRGIVRRAHAVSHPLHLIVDLVETLERMPERSAFTTDLLGKPLPRCPIPRRGVADSAHQLLLLKQALHALVHPDGDEFA